jgi:cell wall-associated NlpC family hydrolase
MVDYRPLTGKQWEYGKQDCYTLVRDYFALLGIELPDFERPVNLQRTDSIFLRHANTLQFDEVAFNDRKEGDVLIMRLGTRTPMHAAIYLKDDRILHQRMNSISAIEPLTRYYRDRVSAVYRHATGHARR